MKKSMCITYEVENSLYVNITNKCSNRCVFCIRNNGDTAYGSAPLWLEREPTVQEIIDSILEREVEKYSEIVFCGYGEPSFRLKEARAVALLVKEKYPDMKIRINTNGQSDLILGKDSAPLYEGAFDEVSISLNAPTGEKYQSICHSIYGEKVLDYIIKFATNVNKYVQNTKFSVVRYGLTDEEIEECKKISERAGIPLRIREFIN